MKHVAQSLLEIYPIAPWEQQKRRPKNSEGEEGKMKTWRRRASQTSLVTNAVRSIIHVVETPKPQRVILLPGNRTLRAAASSTKEFLRAMATTGAAAVKSAGGADVKMKLLDSIHEDGAKLVEITAAEAQKLRAVQPGLLIVPEVFFQPAVQMYQVEKMARPSAARGAERKVVVKIVSQGDGHPVAGAQVVAFTNFAAREGAGGATSQNGTVTLTLPSTVKMLERLYVYPENSFWGSLQLKVKLASNITVELAPIDLAAEDSVRYFAGGGQVTDGQGVKVAVIDTGIALGHPDLRVVGGECTVPGEKPGDYGPLGGDHGSHCAGIIAARGTPPTGIRGVAPGAALYSFRVFPKPTPQNPEPGASNFAIAKAIDRAFAAGCDLLNLSLGGGQADAATEAAIQDARNAGAVVIAAAGNDGRQPVSFPASYDLCVAVSALGRIGLFPAGSVDRGDVAPPYGTDKKNFIAQFSNIGRELDCTGPGVGVISTVPDKAYAVMSGTSMATPAVTGLATRLLGKNPGLLNAARDASRADGIAKMVLQSAGKLGFGANYEGQGLPKG
ncbi:MAG: peptidase S8/S53 subtilisin kexin sedolisin [Candidatus Rokuibacteriota bacterium]|nr:MAG: peptidase S8/S53 subtilisin kexin sedolisin [Candidatus Rokubacteria bacterium]